MQSAEGGSAGKSTPESQGRPALLTLAPEFDAKNHGVYRDLIIEAIDHDPTVRNLALTGGYGTGKSSVLRDVSKHYGPRVVELSLASLASAGEQQGIEVSRNPAATTPTNRIQKEIVKQLLYRLAPSETPESRFPRATKSQPALRWSLGWGAAAFALLFGTGLIQALVAALVDTWWRQAIAYVCAFLATVGLAWLLRLNRGRLRVDSISAGPAKVTLSPASSSYFDEYLDEIVYFFAVSGCDIVVFEDIDRFEDTHIFETLRALNTLLNGAEYLRAAVPHSEGSVVKVPGERIVFIYAISDTVFERFGVDSTGSDKPPTLERPDDFEKRDTSLALTAAAAARDRVQDELVRANRTKFFELIIPVVPFITTNNARDLMKTTMLKAGQTISPELIKLAARHVADMRLILNICNEFQVYRERLLEVDDPMPGLTDDLLFALIVFKNTHPADFEAIRLQGSRLDTLQRLWRRLVNRNIKVLTDEGQTRRRALAAQRAAPAHSRELGERLLEVRDRIASANIALSQLSLDSRVIDDDEVRTRAFWASLADGAGLSFGSPGRVQMTFSAEDLVVFLGLRIPPAEWVEIDVDDHTARIEQGTRDVWFLRHHTWKQLYTRDEFTVRLGGSRGGEDGEELTFRQLAERVLESRLARELVRDGYIDENFALYVSTFYGEHVRAAATEYIMRSVRTGEPDTSYLLTREDVDAILSDEGDAILRDPSMYNVSIVDHLLATRPADAATVARELLAWGERERRFVDAYLAQGADPAGLVGLMARAWPRAFTYLVTDAPVDDERRLALINAALRACSQETTYELDEDVRSFLNDNYEALPSISDPANLRQADAAFAVVQAAGSIVAAVAALNSLACQEVIARRLYPVTAENLAALAKSDNIALDTLLRADANIYIHALSHQLAYLEAVRASDTTTATVIVAQEFARIVTDAARSDKAAGLGGIIHSAHARCTVPRLTSVPAAAWPTLAASGRTTSTFVNVQAYVAEFGGIDESLAALLRMNRRVTAWSEAPVSDRLALATTIVNARELLPGIRLPIQLIKSLRPGVIPAASIDPVPGTLLANLIKGHLIADDEDAFDPRLMVDWPTLDATIRASKRYESFVSPRVLPAAYVAPLILSSVLLGIREDVVRRLPLFLEGASKRSAQAVAEALLAKGWQLPISLIDAVQAAGASSASVVRLLGLAGEMVSVEALRARLRTLPKPYDGLADPLGSRPTVPDDAHHRAVLDRLTAARVVKNHKPDRSRPGMRRVTTHRS